MIKIVVIIAIVIVFSYMVSIVFKGKKRAEKMINDEPPDDIYPLW